MLQKSDPFLRTPRTEAISVAWHWVHAASLEDIVSLLQTTEAPSSVTDPQVRAVLSELANRLNQFHSVT